MTNGLLIQYMEKYLRISWYIRKPFLIYDFPTAPFWISLNMRKIWFSFLSVYDPNCQQGLSHEWGNVEFSINLCASPFNEDLSKSTTFSQAQTRKMQDLSINCYFCMKLMKKTGFVVPLSYLGIGIEIMIIKLLLRCNNHDRK
jgi:hypothetical protein